MVNQNVSYSRLWFGTDLLLLAIVFFVSDSVASLGFADRDLINIGVQDLLLLLLLMIVWYFTTEATNLYSEYRSKNFSYELVTFVKCVLWQVIAAVLIIFFVLKGFELNRFFILFYSINLLIFIGIKKYIIRKVFYNRRARGKNLKNILIIGAGELGTRFHEAITANKHFGYNLVGFLDDDEEKELLDGPYLGKIKDLEQIMEDYEVEEIIIALPNNASDRIEEVIQLCENYTTRVFIIPDYFRFTSGKFQVSSFGPFPIIALRKLPLDIIHNKFVKRSFDLIVSFLVCLLILSWLVPFIMILIKLSSKGPAIFKQERWGLNNEKIICFKFRSMVEESKDVNECGEYQQAKQHDPRINKLGRVLRKTNIDELPQFWNVVLGDMSIVGPRPHPIPLNIESKDKIDRYLLRHLVKPGITGWAQVNGYRGPTHDHPRLMEKRVQYDIWYIENWTFWLDLQIMFYTVWKMFTGDDKAF